MSRYESSWDGYDEGDNDNEMNPGSGTKSYPAFALNELSANSGKDLNQETFPNQDSIPGPLVSQSDTLATIPNQWTTIIISCDYSNIHKRRPILGNQLYFNSAFIFRQEIRCEKCFHNFLRSENTWRHYVFIDIQCLHRNLLVNRIAGLAKSKQNTGVTYTGDDADEMSTRSSTESYPAFARIGLRKNPGKNLNQVTCPDWDSNPSHLVSRVALLINSNAGISALGIICPDLTQAPCYTMRSVLDDLLKPKIPAHVSLPPLRVCWTEEIKIGFCKKEELLRNNRHHRARTAIANLLRNRGWEVHEEIHCVSEYDSHRGVDIISINRRTQKAMVLDPTICFERDTNQALQINDDKRAKYVPCLPYLSEKYGISLYNWDVTGLLFGARGYHKTKISLAQDTTKKISVDVNIELRQGCGLSPILFDLYLNKIIEEWRKREPKGILLNQRNIDTICFADDQVILAENEELQRAVNNLNKIAKDFSMTISNTKTKSMALKGKIQKRIKIVINQEVIEQVSNFTYLGTKISTMSAQTNIEENLQKYNKLNGCIKRHFGKGMRKEIKLRIHNITSKQALKFASETWVLRAKDKSRTETAHMRFLRSTLGVTRRGRLRNKDIRNQLQQENMVEEIQRYQKQWQEHVLRMGPSRLPRQAFFTDHLEAETLGDR
ncbi:hypothetical protein ANN_19868 [Periplaneta americana]|uniref:Reverse transcriptase domain-containing protein n=1 Tax=Periplaneta americana TaxID=6978 RepID=A0ABQ8SC70_PERAM|nr:hypothetical protein ANN_19868 [Periplaneta americana]